MCRIQEAILTMQDVGSNGKQSTKPNLMHLFINIVVQNLIYIVTLFRQRLSMLYQIHPVVKFLFCSNL